MPVVPKLTVLLRSSRFTRPRSRPPGDTSLGSAWKSATLERIGAADAGVSLAITVDGNAFVAAAIVGCGGGGEDQRGAAAQAKLEGVAGGAGIVERAGEFESGSVFNVSGEGVGGIDAAFTRAAEVVGAAADKVQAAFVGHVGGVGARGGVGGGGVELAAGVVEGWRVDVEAVKDVVSHAQDQGAAEGERPPGAAQDGAVLVGAGKRHGPDARISEAVNRDGPAQARGQRRVFG